MMIIKISLLDGFNFMCNNSNILFSFLINKHSKWLGFIIDDLGLFIMIKFD